ncbi:hypothetical protein ACFY2G_02090 [Streptomyces collinus]|uniref:hypothetical protein n=1 Tax=Streptomyces collinus TaxID=42684 RepID=UPI0034365614
MQGNMIVTGAGQDDLVIEEFGRNAIVGQVPRLCLGCGVALPESAKSAQYTA